MNKEQIDKMVRVDFCGCKEKREELYKLYKIVVEEKPKEEEPKNE